MGGYFSGSIGSHLGKAGLSRDLERPPVGPPVPPPSSGGYADVVDGIIGNVVAEPIAHWRQGEAGGTQIVERKTGRHGTYQGAVLFQAVGLPQNSDNAVDYAGTGYGEIPHDAGLALPAFSLSLWFQLRDYPSTEGEGRIVLISKGQAGLFLGDVDLMIESDGGIVVQFQTGSTQHPLHGPTIALNVPHHLVVRADATGFDAYLNGLFIGKITAYTDAWASNTQPLHFGAAPWLFASGGSWPIDAILFDGILDEVAIYPRVLALAEIISLAQITTPPDAVDDSFTVTSEQTTVLDVVQNDIYVGAKQDLAVAVTSPPTYGSANVRGDKNIDLVMGPIPQDPQADSFAYKIADVIGESTPATVGLTVQEAPPPPPPGSGDDGQGGTLIYHWEPLASWIDGVPLSERDTNDIVGDGINHWWQDGANPANGGNRIGHDKLITVDWSGVQNSRWNRAPTGHPSLEGVAATTLNAVWLWALLFWNAGVTNPRHLRVVVELKHSVPSDPNTYRDGGGTYGDFASSFQGDHSGKYFGGLTAGPFLSGSCRTNWYQRLPGTGGLPWERDKGYMANAFGNNGDMRSYAYFYGRDAACGGPSAANPGGVNVIHSSMNGKWNRFEYEVKLQNPALVNSSWGGTSFPSGGDGFIKLFVTKDIDGTPSPRILFVNALNLVLFGSDNNYHQTVNLRGNFMNQYHGGTAVPKNGYSVWMRKLQIYHVTEDDL